MQLEVEDCALLLDMLMSANIAIQYAQHRSRSDLDENRMLADALVRRIEIVGEAARGISNELKSRTPEIAWRAIIATRHILAHDYNEVDHDILWRVVAEHLPKLVAQLDALLTAETPSTDVPPP